MAGITPGTQHDQVDVTGTISLAGILNLVPLFPYSDPLQPGFADEFDVILAGNRLGHFDDISYAGASLEETFASPTAVRSYVGNGLFRILEYRTDGIAFLNYGALPGDANGDLVVDGSDFGIWNANKFTSGTDWITGDFNGDGITDGSDFGIWNAHKFTTAQRASSQVPETMGQLLVLAVLLAARRIERRLGLL